MPEDQRSQAADHLRILTTGEVEVIGRLPWSSNRTFLVMCRTGDEELAAVYKPGRGERALWDFPECVYRREIAAYELSKVLDWRIVPETVERTNATFGPGSLQRFVQADFSQHHFTLVDDVSNHDQLRTICCFDVVANNTDRKSGHCIVDEDGTIWAIDNSLCFHSEPKLRTVIWEFAGEEVPEELLGDVERLARDADATEPLGRWLSGREIGALRRRAARLVDDGRFPVPGPDHYHYPWPLV